MLPTRMYAKDAGGLYVDLFIGSAVTLEYVAGADVEVVQENGYPWDGSVGISINLAGRRTLSVRVRIPDRMVSRLNRAAPDANGITSRDHRDLRGRIGSAGDAELRAGDPGGGHVWAPPPRATRGREPVCAVPGDAGGVDGGGVISATPSSAGAFAPRFVSATPAGTA